MTRVEGQIFLFVTTFILAQGLTLIQE